MMLEGSERPLSVKFAEEQQSKRDRQNRRYPGNKGYRESGGMGFGGDHLRGMYGEESLADPFSGGMAISLGSPLTRPSRGYGRNMNFSPYPLIGAEEPLAWMSSAYQNPRGPVPGSPYQPPPFIGSPYEGSRRQNNMFLGPPALTLPMPAARGYGFAEVVGLRISE